MPPTQFNFTTGTTNLPDVGTLSYNGCVFSPLFTTQIGGQVVKDNAGRTTKVMEYNLEADGYVTLPAGAADINPAMNNLRQLLTVHAGILIYKGRGFDLVVNTLPNNRDAMWGPVPELIEFQPLGGGLSAKVKWKVKVRISESTIEALAQPSGRGAGTLSPLLQFNCETTVAYGADGYSSLGVKGTMEIPLTRPTQATRTVELTVDNFRDQLQARIFAGIDLARFTITQRDFNVSRDKRTMEFDVKAEEKPYMDLPPDCTVAHGNYSVKPAKAGMGLVLWLCTLRGTYVVRADRGRRTAWFAFLQLLRLRMGESRFGTGGQAAPAPAGGGGSFFGDLLRGAVAGANPLSGFTNFNLFRPSDSSSAISGALGVSDQRAFLIDFSIDEGLFLDSKTVTFSATWKLITQFQSILVASGLWKKLPETNRGGRGTQNLWALSVRDVMGSQSWLPNQLDPALDFIVDFGGN